MDADAIFFDAGSTLIYPDPPVAEVYARALRRAGVEAEEREVHSRYEEVFSRLRGEQAAGTVGYGCSEAEAMDWWRRVVRETFEPFGLPAAFEEVFRCLWDYFASPEAWAVYDDVFPTLDRLERRGKGLGLISNWDVRLERLLKELGLWGRLRWAAISCRVGAEKPAPAIFQAALAQCGLPAGRTLHVGDSLREDVLGARQAGMQALWLRRHGSDQPAPPGVAVICSLAELPGLVS